jgi:hypothetical protein
MLQAAGVELRRARQMKQIISPAIRTEIQGAAPKLVKSFNQRADVGVSSLRKNAAIAGSTVSNPGPMFACTVMLANNIAHHFPLARVRILHL